MVRPAYSSQFAAETLRRTARLDLEGIISADWAWGDSTGHGVRVGVIDSGIDATHPAVGSVQGWVSITEESSGLNYDTAPHEDLFGHGTACAGIIRSLAPNCELYSIRVLGSRLTTRGTVFAAGVRWALEHKIHVCNLSLGTTRREYFAPIHELADAAYFHNVMLVAAANNAPVPSFPSTYASVISVAAHENKDPYLFYYNPDPPVEFGAPGIDLRVPWLDGQWITTTGNSYAAPHMTGVVSRILGKHPELTVFEMKTILRALAGNTE